MSMGHNLKRLFVSFVCAMLTFTAYAGMETLHIAWRTDIPLPKGDWSELGRTDFNFCKPGSSCRNVPGEIHVLKNNEPNAAVFGLVIRFTSRKHRSWRHERCYADIANAYHDNFGTSDKDNLTLCARGWQGVVVAPSYWESHWWWKDVVPLAKDLPAVSHSRIELEMHSLNSYPVYITLFVKKEGTTWGEIDRFNTLLKEWIHQYALTAADVLYENNEVNPSALAWTTPVLTPAAENVPASSQNLLAGTAQEATQDDATRSLPEPSYCAEAIPRDTTEELQRKLKTQITDCLPTVRAELMKRQNFIAEADRETAEASASSTQTEQARKNQERLAQAENARLQEASTEQLRLEQERLSLAKQKESMASELAAMREMLAEMKKANELAARPVKLTPARPVVMARRRALVIGNDNYRNVQKLENAVGDAKSMASALEELGYKVDLHANLTERGFKRALRDFRADLKGGEEVLFFYAGHGVQLGNSNYLLPVDLGSDSSEQVQDESIELQKVLDDLSEQKTKFALAVIDACRDNPFKQAGRAIGGRGLAPTTAATGQMVMFSAGAGQQALDKLGTQDKERNGLFTRVFLEEMKKPGIPVDKVLRNVRQRVVSLARSVGHEQVPALYDQAVGEFFFRPN